MRRPLIAALLGLLLLPASASPSSVELPARRTALHPKSAAGRAAATLPAEVQAPYRDRIRRWRSRFDLLTAPGVDWSRAAARAARRGRPGTADLRRALPLAGEEPAGAAALGPPDTLRVALIRIDFLRDSEARGPSSGNGRFDLTPPDTNAVPIDRAPHNRDYWLQHGEALRRYFGAQSYGRVHVEARVYPAEQDSAYHVGDMADFGPWTFDQDIYEAAVTMFQTMLRAADEQSRAKGDRVPWQELDRVILIHAGSDLQSDVRQDTPEDIPSFTIGVHDSDAVVVRDLVVPGDSLLIDRAAVCPESATQDGFYGAVNGVLAHECGHLFFGLADLYNTATGFPVVGFWSLMDSGNLVGSIVELKNGDQIFVVGLIPPGIDPLQRFFVTDTLVFAPPRQAAVDTLLPVRRFPDVRQVLQASGEYLLLENRHVPDSLVVRLRQDSATRVVLGPGDPDTTNYDLLVPGSGILVWHVDESVAFEGGLRENPDFGVNSNPLRPGISVVEADGLADLGDPSSPLALGSPFDPYFLSNNRLLADDTTPNARTWSGTRPHVRIEFLTDPDSIMAFRVTREWLLPGWPAAADFPPEGPLLLVADADGNRRPDVAWAGGADSLVVTVPGGVDSLVPNPDSTALFAVRWDGRGIHDSTAVIHRFPRRPFREAAALPLGVPDGTGQPTQGPALFAVVTRPDPADTSAGRVYLVDHQGGLLPGWPAMLPRAVTAPPVLVGAGNIDTSVYVGCAGGKVYHLNGSGQVLEVSNHLDTTAVIGRMAVWGGGQIPGAPPALVGVMHADGNVEVAGFGTLWLLPCPSTWPKPLAAPGETPGLLWVNLENPAQPSGLSGLCTVAPALIVQRPGTLLAFFANGDRLPGWGIAGGDSLVGALAAGDVDRDGLNEPVTLTRTSKLAWWDASGAPSPGWPRGTTRESFASGGSPLAVDVDGDGTPEMVALNASGMLVAFRADGGRPAGWPVASGVGATGSPCFADLDLDGSAEIVGPDRQGRLWAWSVGVPYGGLDATPWPMLGGGPGRTFALEPASDPQPRASSSAALVEPGSLKVYPNPARFSDVSFAFRMLAPGQVECIILDASGHEVARWSQAALRSDNVLRWSPGKAPAGLYLARLRFSAGGRDQVEVRPVGLLR